jgi:hypothetical protein
VIPANFADFEIVFGFFGHFLPPKNTIPYDDSIRYIYPHLFHAINKQDGGRRSAWFRFPSAELAAVRKES